MRQSKFRFIIISVIIIILIILFFIFIPNQCRFEKQKPLDRDPIKPEIEKPTEIPKTLQEKTDKTPSVSTIVSTPTPEKSVSEIPATTLLKTEGKLEEQNTPSFPPASPVSQLQYPDPGCVYIGSNEIGWYCYKGRMRLLAFHDWYCKGRKLTQVEILEETTTTCIGDEGIDMFDIVNKK